jgi:ethanolamine utilization protein EutQ (cupin superfamily)
MGSTSPPTFTHLPQAQQTYKPPLIANENAYLGDVATSQENDPTSPVTCGFYRLEKGTPLVYEYTYHEMKIILEGSFTISDETGKKVHARKGDVFHFPKGSKITFETDDYGLAFYTGQRKEGAA